MGGCTNYTALCAPADSVVMQCDDFPPLPGLPTTAEVQGAISGICNSHNMEGCDTCTIDPGCDLMAVYSSLCLVMPDMAECASWKTMCETVPSWTAWCPASDPTAGQAPIMKMYFHTGIVDYVLFQGWVPRTNGQYIATLLAIIVIGIVLEGLRTLRHYCECRWAVLPLLTGGSSTASTVPKPGSPYQNLNDLSDGTPAGANADKPLPGWAPQPFRVRVDLLRAALSAVEALLSYSLMLVAMTFNVGMFLSVLAGLFIGVFIFGRYRSYQPAKECC